MTESEGEIEYLDEDEEIVNQCVQIASLNLPVIPKTEPGLKQTQDRVTKQIKRKSTVYDTEGSDYDPAEDLRASQRRKIQPQAKNSFKITQQPPKAVDPFVKRRKVDIQIPDYEDPLCLPVKLVKQDDSDVKRLRNWNNLCLDHMKNTEECLKPKEGKTATSKRTIALRNVRHAKTGKIELTVWSKTSVENDEGDKKSEVFQCILPRYREKTVLNYPMPIVRKPKTTKTVHEVILQREEQKDENTLVVYKPLEAVSSVYKLVEEREASEGQDVKDNPLGKRYLQEISAAKVCAPCYQASWRPTRNKGDNREVSCMICQRVYMSVYNFLSHIRTHSADEVAKHRRQISKALSKLVDYHYNCRICQQSFTSIREMRTHVTQHKSKGDKFRCEVGNHVTH